MKSTMKISNAQTNFIINKAIVCFYPLIILLTLSSLQAAPITVYSVPSLQSAINNSRTGDIIILANGTYRDNTLNIGKSNITVSAETPGGVFLNGTNDINITGSFITFSGFQFTEGNIGTGYLIELYGRNNLLTQLNFSGYFAKKYIEMKAGSQYNEVSYCNIEKKPEAAELGCTIQILTSTTTPGYHKIRYCSFKDFYGLGGDNGNEPIRIGLGAESLNVSRTVVENCYFNNTGLGDSESVSVKCQENVIRFCTFTNQQNAMLVFRNGDNNVAYSNFFINAGGIRVKESNNIYVYNNYFENCGDGIQSAPVKYLYDEKSIKNHLNNLNFIHNTFVGGTSIELGKLITLNNGGIIVTTFTNNTWANNIFMNTKARIFSEMVTGNSFAGNIYNGTLGISILPVMTNADPLLVTNADAYQGLSASSPAINAASSEYPPILDIANLNDDPGLLFDISGQARPSTVTSKDVGCDEYTTGAKTNHPLSLSEVGPSYLGGPSLSVNSKEMIDSHNGIMIFPSLAKKEITISTSAAIGNVLSVSFYNSIGQKVKMDTDFQNQGGSQQYDVSDLNNGIYFVKVTSKEFSKTMKLIIQK